MELWKKRKKHQIWSNDPSREACEFRLYFAIVVIVHLAWSQQRVRHDDLSPKEAKALSKTPSTTAHSLACKIRKLLPFSTEIWRMGEKIIYVVALPTPTDPPYAMFHRKSHVWWSDFIEIKWANNWGKMALIRCPSV